MTDLKTPQRPDPEQTERAEAFRADLQKTDHKALGVALATGAFALAARPAFAQEETPSVTEILNFALTLEYLERAFYNMGIPEDGGGVVRENTSGEYDAVGKYEEIRNDEQAHVQVLQDALGDDAVDEPEFDFTAGGTFDPFGSYTQFLVLSQGFEDTGVRAYKGQAPNLLADDASDATLTTALKIHSVEARHAALVRRLVSKEGISADQEAWIERNGQKRPVQNMFGDPLAPTYAGMDEIVKYMINVVDNSDVDEVEVTEAFDEELDMQAVLDIAGIFIVDNG